MRSIRAFALSIAIGTILASQVPAQAATQRCAGSQLRVEVVPLSPDVYEHVKVRITNTAEMPCLLRGNPRILLTDGAAGLNLPVGYASGKLPNHTPSAILLAPDDSASVALSQARCPGRVTARARGLVLMPGRGSVSVRSDRLRVLGVCDGDATLSSLGVGDFSAG